MKKAIQYFAGLLAAAVVLQILSGAAFALGAQISPPNQSNAAGTLPNHILLPVLLVHTIDSRHAVPGQPILGKTVQHIQIGQNQWIPKGALVHGRILAVQTASDHSAGPGITFEFDSVTSKRQTWQVKTSLVAVASLMEVYDATEPATNFDDRGNQNEHAWTMRQIGGDMVYHDTGWIYNRHGERVGTEDPNGNYALPVAQANGGAALPLAVGLFSTTAKGVYGMPGYTLANTGTTSQIMAGPEAKHLHLPYGISVLLETQP